MVQFQFRKSLETPIFSTLFAGVAFLLGVGTNLSPAFAVQVVVRGFSGITQEQVISLISVNPKTGVLNPSVDLVASNDPQLESDDSQVVFAFAPNGDYAGEAQGVIRVESASLKCMACRGDLNHRPRVLHISHIPKNYFYSEGVAHVFSVTIDSVGADGFQDHTPGQQRNIEISFLVNLNTAENSSISPGVLASEFSGPLRWYRTHAQRFSWPGAVIRILIQPEPENDELRRSVSDFFIRGVGSASDIIFDDIQLPAVDNNRPEQPHDQVFGNNSTPCVFMMVPNLESLRGVVAGLQISETTASGNSRNRARKGGKKQKQRTNDNNAN